MYHPKSVTTMAAVLKMRCPFQPIKEKIPPHEQGIFPKAPLNATAV